MDVNESGDSTTVTVRRGDADVAANTSFPVHENQSVVINSVNPAAATNAAIGMDDFENWALTRDRREETAMGGARVSPDIVGAADLAQYGSWRDAPGYGSVWAPRVNAEWVPYRYGHWVWVDPWGWTWIDDAPWGFAPFHYGRWVAIQGSWVWAPGRVEARPVYAPALVAFVGGEGFRVTAAAGPPVAWFPLGPREVYVPAYSVSAVYVRAVNTPHVVVTDVAVSTANVRYVNREIAVTAVPRDVFVRARPVAAATVVVTPEAARAAVVVGAAVPARPEHIVVHDPVNEGVNGRAAIRVAAPPAAVMSRRVIMKQTPPAQAAAPAPVSVAAPAAPQRQPPQAVTPQRLTPSATAPAPGAASAPAAASAAAAPAPQHQAPPAVTPPASPRPPNPQAAELAARHAQERAAIDARHAQERAQLQAQHQEAERQATAAQRPQLKTQHQAEMKALQERHQQERVALQQKQAAEKKPPAK